MNNFSLFNIKILPKQQNQELPMSAINYRIKLELFLFFLNIKKKIFLFLFSLLSKTPWPMNCKIQAIMCMMRKILKCSLVELF